MSDDKIRFDDGAAYELMMGVWSQLAGNIFLDWLAPPPKLAWLDVGCGSGAFTEQIVERCAPAEVHGVDPAEGQLAFARTRPAARKAIFRVGDALALPFDDNRFDTAVMALVIHFVPDPAKAVAEMVRVARPGGIVSAYVWDYSTGASPMTLIRQELAAMGSKPATPPGHRVTGIESLRALWSAAGLADTDTREIPVTRNFADFDEYWTITTRVALGPSLVGMSPSDLDQLKARTRARLRADDQGRIVAEAKANAVKGRVPA